MTEAWHRRLWRQLMLPGILMLPACALAVQPSHAPEYRVTGRVVDAASGSPLARVEVAVLPAAGGQAAGPRMGRGFGGGNLPPALASVTTDASGRFDLEHLPAGKYSLRGSRRGYLTTTYQQHGQFSTAVVTGEGLSTDGLTLRLLPGGVISGNVTDTSGDPVERASVKLYQLADDGVGGIHSFRTAISDDLGAYEFAQLPPGTYFVSATGRVWYATPSQTSSADPVPSPSNLDVAYPRSFYADTTDSRAATPLPIKGGERLRADLHMHAEPAVHLRYPEGVSPQQRISELVFGEREDAPANLSVDSFPGGPEPRQVATANVAPGQYELDVGDRTVSINATGNVQIDVQNSVASVSVSGKVGAAAGADLPDRVSLQLEPLDAGRRPVNATTTDDGDFSMDQVRPGNYEMVARGRGRNMAIMQIAAQGAQLDGHILKVGTQPVTLAATLAPASSVITGYAREGQQAASGVMIVLVPEHLGDHALYRRDQSDSDGSFSLAQVAAGKYTLVAIRDGWDLDWARPEVIGRYLQGGQVVTVDGSTGAVKQPKPLAVQAR